ncbi:MAG: prepilin-type N-terminal cleavage/methylation domain-containing protein [Hydrogenovibrio sp.]
MKSVEQSGFTLLELALALLLIGLLAGSYLRFASDVSGDDHDRATESQLRQVQQGLRTFLQVNGYLPCPDEDGDGFEDRSGGSRAQCRAREGYLPSKQIGAPLTDTWGQRFYYRVNDRAKTRSRINDVCETASVFAREGEVLKPTEAGLCEETQVFYCDCSRAKLHGACSGECNFDFQPRTEEKPPYFTIDTPPVGVDKADSLKNLVVLDAVGERLDAGVVAMVVSFGRFGDQAWSNCAEDAGLPASVLENCDGDRDFQMDVSGRSDAFLTWLNIWDVKEAMLEVDGFAQR